MMIVTYSELIKLKTFEDRFNYLKEILKKHVGEETFGYDRYLNQQFYHSYDWKNFRRQMILRDNGCDLSHPDYPIRGNIFLHHLNPIEVQDFEVDLKKLLDPENIVCVSFNTHNALHYGSIETLPKIAIERLPNDTCPWRKCL